MQASTRPGLCAVARRGARALASMVLLALLCSVTANSSGPGSCSGPSSGHGNAQSSTSPYTLVASSPLQAGVQGTLVLSGSATFKGFLLLNPASGTLSGVTSPGASVGCGYGHTEATPKSSVSFTYTPSLSASSVTFSMFVVGSQAAWWGQTVTLQIAGAQTALPPAAQPPPQTAAPRPPPVLPPPVLPPPVLPTPSASGYGSSAAAVAASTVAALAVAGAAAVALAL